MSRNVKGDSYWNRHKPYLTVDRVTSYVTLRTSLVLVSFSYRVAGE